MMTHNNCAERPQRTIKCEAEENLADAATKQRRSGSDIRMTPKTKQQQFIVQQRKAKIQQKEVKQKTSMEFESSHQQQLQHNCTYILLAGWSIGKATITTCKHMYILVHTSPPLQRF